MFTAVSSVFVVFTTTIYNFEKQIKVLLPAIISKGCCSIQIASWLSKVQFFLLIRPIQKQIKKVCQGGF